jgi:hypothetical protein
MFYPIQSCEYALPAMYNVSIESVKYSRLLTKCSYTIIHASTTFCLQLLIVIQAAFVDYTHLTIVAASVA